MRSWQAGRSRDSGPWPWFSREQRVSWPFLLLAPWRLSSSPSNQTCCAGRENRQGRLLAFDTPAQRCHCVRVLAAGPRAPKQTERKPLPAHVPPGWPAGLRPGLEQSLEPPSGSDAQTTAPGTQDPRDRDLHGAQPWATSSGAPQAVTARARTSRAIDVKSPVSLPPLHVCRGFCLL